jgi:hypothetical protein
MTEKLTHLKNQISVARRSGRARYPDELRAVVLEELSRWRSSGRPRSGLAEVLGLDGSTLASWEKSTQTSARRSKVKAVSVVDKPAGESDRVVAIVVLPSGVRIEAMSVLAALELARALA